MILIWSTKYHLCYSPNHFINHKIYYQNFWKLSRDIINGLNIKICCYLYWPFKLPLLSCMYHYSHKASDFTLLLIILISVFTNISSWLIRLILIFSREYVKFSNVWRTWEPKVEYFDMCVFLPHGQINNQLQRDVRQCPYIPNKHAYM